MDGTASAAAVTVRGDFSGSRQSDTGAGNGRFNGRRVSEQGGRSQQNVFAGDFERVDRFAGPVRERRSLRSRLVSTIRSAIRLLNPLALMRRAPGREEAPRRMDPGGGSHPPGHAAGQRPAGVRRPPGGLAPAEQQGWRSASLQGGGQAARSADREGLPMDPDFLRRADEQAERVVQLLQTAQTRALGRDECQEVRRLVNLDDHHVPPRLLSKLGESMVTANRFDADMKKADRLLDRANKRVLTRLERQELRDLERSMKARVGSTLKEKRVWLEILAGSRQPSPLGAILADYMNYRFVDRGAILVERIMPRVRTALSVDPQAPGQRAEFVHPHRRGERTSGLRRRSNVVSLRPSPPIELQRFARVARHRDRDRVIVLDGDRVRALPESRIPPGHDCSQGAAAFKASLKTRFGSFSGGLNYLDSLEAEGKALRVGDVKQILASNQAIPGLTPGGVISEPSEMHLLLVGGGPRTSTQVAEEIRLLKKPAIRKDIESLEALGGKFTVRTTIVEKRGADSIGMGEAWNRDQEGSVNTGAEGWGYEERLRTYFRENRAALLEQMKDFPPTQAMFLAAFREADQSGTANPGGEVEGPRVNKAATLRFQEGLEEYKNFEALKQFADTDHWFRKRYRLEVVGDTEVTAVDASPPLGARVLTSSPTREDGFIEADLVRMNTGTTLGSPLTPEQDEVKERSYIGPMCRRKLRAFLDSKALLDERGRLKPGTRVLTGGSGLSLYDQLLVLGSFMDLTEIDESSPKGWKITEYAKRHHQGAILITSNNDGKWISPRHAHAPTWTQKLKPISNSREQHALFLHNQSEEIYMAWQDICVASIAAANGMTPAQVRHEGLNTQQLMDLQKAENTKHFNASPKEKTRTLYGARREAYLGTVLGMGLEPDPGKSVKALEEAAPLTYKGRWGYMIHRAQVCAITDPDAPISRNNQKLIAVHNERFQDVTASPAIIHSLAAELVDAGIARYVPGSYRDIAVAADGSPRALVFKDKTGAESLHDFFLVSPTFKLTDSPAEMSLQGQVEPLDAKAPQIARVGGNRLMRDPDKNPVNVESYSIAGKGIRRTDGSFVGTYAYDTNNRESAVQVAPGLAYRRLAIQLLAAAGRLDPVGEVETMYRDLYPAEDAYREEVESFRGDFESAMVKAALVRKAEELAGGDPEAFRSSYEIYARLADQPEILARLARVVYGNEDIRIPEFAPASRDRYFGRFVDAPDHIHEQVYMRALREARMTLGGQATLVA